MEPREFARSPAARGKIGEVEEPTSQPPRRGTPDNPNAPVVGGDAAGVHGPAWDGAGPDPTIGMRWQDADAYGCWREGVRIRRAALLDEKKYGAILADPPWSFEAWSTYKPLASGGMTRAVERYYKTMSLDDIIAFPVADRAAKDCTLFLWACWPSFPDALKVIEAWGFTYKTMGFIWVKGEGLPLFPEDIKDQVGLGYWTRANTEPCILATRGHPKRLNADVRQVILDKRREHSRKPDCVYERIERLVDGPYLELFARQRWPGWDQWGNEVDKFTASPGG